MSVIDDLKKINVYQYFIAAVLIGAIFGPGILICYHYRLELFVSSDLSKLLVFSAALTFPAVLLNYVLFITKFPPPPNTTYEIQLQGCTLFAALKTVFSLNGVILITALLHTPFRTFVVFETIFEPVSTILLLVILRKRARIRQIHNASAATTNQQGANQSQTNLL